MPADAQHPHSIRPGRFTKGNGNGNGPCLSGWKRRPTINGNGGQDVCLKG
jgi:hypothetical protein